MIIVKLDGGLGNQMFQYAVGRAITYKNKMKLKLDKSALNNDPLRSYSLNHFNIIEDFATYEDIINYFPSRRHIYKWVISKIKKRYFSYYLKPVIKERHEFTFDPSIIEIKNKRYLIGFWQNENYFKSVNDIIKKDFSLKGIMSEENLIIYKEIKMTNAVSLHVRRGDYASCPKTYQFHGILPLDYYNSALEIINKSVLKPIVYIFSDDIIWAKENLKSNLPLRFMSHKNSDIDYEALYLIAACKHHIIANSSFSWWGAWLSDYPGKKVIAPNKWLSPTTMAEMKDISIVPEDWIKI